MRPLKTLNSYKLFTISLIFSLFGCASFTGSQLFSNYNQQIASTLSAIKTNNPDLALQYLPEYSQDNASYVLNQLEKSRLLQLHNDIDSSVQSFNTAIELIDQQRFAADIQISKAVETTTSLITNDNVRSYNVPSYEQTMVHTYQTLNYVTQNNLEAALVEIRRANLVQEYALKQNQEAVLQAADNAKINPSELYARYPSMDKNIGKVKNGFQNAFTFYLSGYIYETAKELDSAYIDYKRAVDIFPNNTYLQHDILRLSKKLGFNEEHRRFKQKFNPTTSPAVPGQGSVLFILEQGLINAKTESRIDLPIYTSNNELRFYSVAMPVYRYVRKSNPPLIIAYDEEIYTTQTIVNLASLAAKDLQDKLPGIAARQVARVIAKEQMRKRAAQNNGDIGNIIASIYNIASERADTRSWLTLPDNYQIAKLFMPNGTHTVQLNINGNNQSINIDVKPNSKTIVKVQQIGSFINTDIYSI
jgi:hypothetical protein